MPAENGPPGGAFPRGVSRATRAGAGAADAGRRGSRPTPPPALDPERPHLLVEVAPLEPERPRGLRHVVGVARRARRGSSPARPPPRARGSRRRRGTDPRAAAARRAAPPPTSSRRDLRAVAEDGEPLDEVPELAHVAGPVVGLEREERLAREAHRAAAVALAGLGEEARRELGDVLAPLAQRRRVDRHDVEPVVEVLAEARRPRPPRRGPCWSRRRPARRTLSVCCRRRARTRPPAARAAAWPASRRACRRPRRGRACRRRPARTCRLRAAIAPVNAPRSWPNSSLSMSSAGHRGAVELHERRVARGASRRGCARATSSLPVPFSPVDEHAPLGRGGPPDELEEPLHRRPAAHHVVRAQPRGGARRSPRGGCAARARSGPRRGASPSR